MTEIGPDTRYVPKSQTINEAVGRSARLAAGVIYFAGDSG
jgi:hypothetical protein